MTLFRQQLRAGLLAAAGWSAGLGLLTYWTATFYTTAARSQAALEAYIRNLPAGWRELLSSAGSLSSLGGWLSMEVFSWLPLLTAVYAATAVATLVSRELDAGTMEFLLGLPVGRHRLLAERFAAFALELAIVHLAVGAGAELGAVAIHQPLPLAAVARVLAMAYLATLAVSALMLLVSLFIADYGRAVLTGLGVGVGLFFADMLLRAAGRGQAVLPWLVYGRFDAGRLLGSGAGAPAAAAVLAGYAAVFLAVALGVFGGRDLGT